MLGILQNSKSNGPPYFQIQQANRVPSFKQLLLRSSYYFQKFQKHIHFRQIRYLTNEIKNFIFLYIPNYPGKRNRKGPSLFIYVFFGGLVTFRTLQYLNEMLGALHYTKVTSQRPVGLTKVNETTFSDQTGLTKENGSYHFYSFHEFLT